MQLPTHSQFFGLHTEGDGALISEDETPDAQNCDTSQDGKLQTRPGMQKAIITALVGSVTHLGYLVFENGTVIKLNITDDGTQQTLSIW